MESAAEVVFKFVSCLKVHHLESVLAHPLKSVCSCLEGSDYGTVRAIRGPQIVHRRHRTQCKLSQRAEDFQRTAAFLLYSCARNPEELKIPHVNKYWKKTKSSEMVTGAHQVPTFPDSP